MKNKKSNKGNSFIMVIATISFLTVLVAAILVAVAFCYRLRAYDINSRDNYYYLEQARDEIFAGVGTDAMKHLNKAYDETVEVVVFFDPSSKLYKTMNNEDANALLKTAYINLLTADPNYATNSTVETHIKSFVTNLYDATSNPEGVSVVVASNLVKTDDGIVIKDLKLRREAKYSSYNAVKSKDLVRPETFVQTISTDINIGKPEFEVDFNTVNSDLDNLYKFAMIADNGVEIIGNTTNVTINGNIYAAADFYNKEYNESQIDVPASNGKGTVKVSGKLNAYPKSRTDTFNGVSEKSMYSGFYIDGSNVTISAEKMIVPGTLAIMNGARLGMSGLTQSVVTSTDLWADNITLGGYSYKEAADSEKLVGSKASLRAKAYISDDLELNAAGSNFVLNGEYYGYSYSSVDDRNYTQAALEKAAQRTFVSAVPEGIKNHIPEKGSDGKYKVDNQAHYNSSAIIVNGKDSTLDLSKTSSIYIAGQVYLEMTKETTATDKKVINKNGDEETVESYTFDYDIPYDKDNYSADSDGNKSAVKDYATGEAISIKSNQLAYIPNWAIHEDKGQMFVAIPDTLENQDLFKKVWDDLSKVPVVKTVLSGKAYYYFDFSETKTLGDYKINDFIAEYSRLVNQMEPDARGDDSDISHGAMLGLTDIGDYSYFKVNTVRLHADASGSEEKNNEYSVFSNNAITIKEPALAVNKEERVTIKAKSSNMKALIAVAENINAAENEKLDNGLTIEDNPNGISTSNMESITDPGNQLYRSTQISTKLLDHYQEMKLLLSNTSRDSAAVQEAHTLAPSMISPINHYFNFHLLDAPEFNDVQKISVGTGYNVWLCGGKEVCHIDTSHQKDAKGIIICKGDVEFDKDLENFDGLIVTGGKIIVNDNINFTANEEVVKTVLRMCDESQKEGKGNINNHEIVFRLFKNYQSFYREDEPGQKIETEIAKSITAVQFEDIVSFKNYMKNVD